MTHAGRFQPIPNLRVVKATGVFGGVHHAAVAQRGGAFRLSLDSWESPIDFDVSSVERDARGRVVSRGTAPPAAGTAAMAIRMVQDSVDQEDGGGAVLIEVTLAPPGGGPVSVLELRALDTRVG